MGWGAPPRAGLRHGFGGLGSRYPRKCSPTGASPPRRTASEYLTEDRTRAMPAAASRKRFLLAGAARRAARSLRRESSAGISRRTWSRSRACAIPADPSSRALAPAAAKPRAKYLTPLPAGPRRPEGGSQVPPRPFRRSCETRTLRPRAAPISLPIALWARDGDLRWRGSRARSGRRLRPPRQVVRRPSPARRPRGSLALRSPASP